MLESDIEYFEKLKAKGWTIIPSKKKQIEMEKVPMEQKDILGVESTAKVMKFFATAWDGTAEALKDDKKVSVLEVLGIAAKLVPQALSLPGALPYVADEIIYDKISEADAAALVTAFDSLQNLKGDPKEAGKELIPILAELKNWGFKWFSTSAGSV